MAANEEFEPASWGCGAVIGIIATCLVFALFTKPQGTENGVPSPVPSRPVETVTWEQFQSNHGRMFRAKVVGGWMVKTAADQAALYVPDTDHAWLSPGQEQQWF